MKTNFIGVDLSKAVFQIHCRDEKGKTLTTKKLTRSAFLKFLKESEPSIFGIEAGNSCHYWAKEIQKNGHQVRMMAAQHVAPYRKSGKNDANDAEAICEAMTRPGMRFVAPKSNDLLDLQAILRVRTGLVQNRTSLGIRYVGFYLTMEL